MDSLKKGKPEPQKEARQLSHPTMAPSRLVFHLCDHAPPPSLPPSLPLPLPPPTMLGLLRFPPASSAHVAL